MPPPAAAAIELLEATKRFGDVAAVERATLGVERGEFLALLGPSGCGKTTLLRLVAGFEVPDAGEVRIGGEPVAGGGAWVPSDRRGVGMVFQDYALFPHLTVAANIGFGLPRRRRAQRVPEALDVVGLRGYEDRHPHELSGGQQQRVALARAVAPEPAIVLLDEPWSNIDPVQRGAMRDELAGILRRLEVTVVLVTHDREEAFSIADRIALVHAGQVVQVDEPEQLYYAPRTRWAAEFVGAANFVAGLTADGHVETQLGRLPVRNPNGKARVEALVRPELVLLEPQPDGPATIVAREFRGHDVFYRVELPDGSVLSSQRPSNELVPLGARVRVRPAETPVSVF